MQTQHDTRPSSRRWRWGLGLVIVAALLLAWWLALDRVATRIGLDAESTLRELPHSSELPSLAD